MAPTFNAIGITVADMARTLAFYRLLGLEFPPRARTPRATSNGKGPGGVRIMFDTVSVIHSFDPDWQPPVGGPAMSLAFECADPAEVDTTVAEVVQAGFTVHEEPWDAFWGQRYATVARPGRQPRRPVRLDLSPDRRGRYPLRGRFHSQPTGAKWGRFPSAKRARRAPSRERKRNRPRSLPIGAEGAGVLLVLVLVVVVEAGVVLPVLVALGHPLQGVRRVRRASRTDRAG